MKTVSSKKLFENSPCIMQTQHLIFWEFPYRKGKISCYWIIIFLCRVIKMKFYWFIAAFLSFFLQDKKLKKLAVALKFLYFLTVVSVNSIFFYQCFLLVLFACKDPSSLYKSWKRRNHLKPENLGIIFLQSALKVPIKSVTSYQADIKYSEADWQI